MLVLTWLTADSILFRMLLLMHVEVQMERLEMFYCCEVLNNRLQTTNGFIKWFCHLPLLN
jgi:hypothetical protein